MTSTDEYPRPHRRGPGPPDWRWPVAFGLGVATFSGRDDGTKVLDTWYPVVNHDQAPAFVALAAEAVGSNGAGGTHGLTTKVIEALAEAVQPVVDEVATTRTRRSCRPFAVPDLPAEPTGVAGSRW